MAKIVDRHIGETWENRRQVIAHGDVHPPAGFDKREDGGDLGSGFLAADMDSVFAAERYGAHGVFGQVVTELEFRVFEEACEFRPKRQRVVRCLAQSASGQ